MTTNAANDSSSIGKMARRGIRKNFDAVSTVAIVQLLIRAAVLAPLLLSVMWGGKLPLWLAAAGSAALYIFLLIPMRFWARQKMRRVYYTRSHHTKHRDFYGKWLATGLLRYLRGILWGLPFIAIALYFTVGRRVLLVKTFEAPISWLAHLLSADPESPTGNMPLALGIIGGLAVVFALLFAYGWWRDLPFEYLPVGSIGTKKTVHWSRRILKKHRSEMRKTTLGNAFLTLPAILGFGAVLGMYVMQKITFTSNMSLNLLMAQVRRLFSEPLSQLTLLELLGVFVVLYLPLCVYRKCRNAALMAKLIKARMHSSSSSSPVTAEDYGGEEAQAAQEARKREIEAWGAEMAAREKMERAQKEERMRRRAEEESRFELKRQQFEEEQARYEEKKKALEEEQARLEARARQFEEDQALHEERTKQFEEEQRKHNAFLSDHS